jgi:hypothetical protein
VEAAVTFYDVGGLLVRRTRIRRGIPLEFWNGDAWAPYSDTDAVLRHGHRLTDARALALLHELRSKNEALMRLPDKDARTALRAPARRS